MGTGTMGLMGLIWERRCRVAGLRRVVCVSNMGKVAVEFAYTVAGTGMGTGVGAGAGAGGGTRDCRSCKMAWLASSWYSRGRKLIKR